VLEKAGGGRGLIVLPLGVRQEFARDAALIGLSCAFIRSIDEASTDASTSPTTRPSATEARPVAVTVLSLDEAAVLRGFGGTKTFREFMRLFEGTATTATWPRRRRARTNSSSCLRTPRSWTIMDVGQAKTRFFKRKRRARCGGPTLFDLLDEDLPEKRQHCDEQRARAPDDRRRARRRPPPASTSIPTKRRATSGPTRSPDR